MSHFIKYEPILHKTVQIFMFQLFAQLEETDERYFMAIRHLDAVQRIRDMKTAL